MPDTITFGDRVTHKLHPDWVRGAVIKVENAIVGCKPAPSVTVRFSNFGLKVFAGNSLPLTPLQGERLPRGC